MPPSLNNISVVPYVEINGQRTIPDDVVRKVFWKLKDDGTLKVVFYEGLVKSEDDLLKLLKNPHNYPCFVFVNDDLRGLAWFNDLHDGYATAHFCVFKESWGRESLEMGKKVLDYWWSFPKGDGPLLDLLLGVTPSKYSHALRFVSQLGFKAIGEVPRILHDAYENKRVNAVLSYCERAT